MKEWLGSMSGMITKKDGHTVLKPNPREAESASNGHGGQNAAPRRQRSFRELWRDAGPVKHNMHWLLPVKTVVQPSGNEGKVLGAASAERRVGRLGQFGQPL